MNNFDRIPSELKELRQWILWKKEILENGKTTKIPYSTFHTLASVTNPNDWSTFDNVVHCYSVGGYDGIGFVFTSGDPYAFIDLDIKENQEPSEVQKQIYSEFDTYSEYSPSGRGLHLIIKGSIPKGLNYGSIELYSNLRYATMTGNVLVDKPIADKHDLLNQLFQQMEKERSKGKSNTNTVSGEETQSDEAILELAFKHNSEKFVPLSLGEWRGSYPSQSEADQAYMNIIGYYTNNKEQVVRIYSKSELAKTDKKRKTTAYLNRTVNKAFDQKLSNVVFEGYDQNSGPVAQRSEPIAHNGLVAGSNPAGTTNSQTIEPPPGLVGDIAKFIYGAAPRPVPEIAIGAAIGLMAGICGKAYNFIDTGLNLYVMCLAKTGRGKEAMASGIDKLINEVQKQVPVAAEFIGPAEIASGQALVKYVANKSSCFVSVLGEFGIRLQLMADPRSNSAEKTLQKTLLELYQKSGYGQIMRSSIFADKDKNTSDTTAPAFSILAEGTPETVYEAADEKMILSGLLPRFIILDYDGDRQFLNKNRNAKPNDKLVNDIAMLMSNAKTLMANNTVKYVQSDEETSQLLDDYDKLTTNRINSKEEHRAIIELWNRAHIKVVKLASLVAIGIDAHNPVINKDIFLWAKQIVEMGIFTLAKKFETGDVGISSNEIKQTDEMTRILKEYVEKDFSYVAKYNATQSLHTSKIVCNTYLSLRLTKMAAFRNDRLGGTSALKRTIQIMIDNGVLKLVGGPEFQERHKITGKAYHINTSILSK